VNLLSLLQDNFGDNTLNVQLIKNIDDELHQLINAQEFRLKEQRILNSISNILNRSLTLSELLKTSLNLISKVLNADRGFVIIHHEHEGSYEVPALRNFTEFTWDSISTEPENFSRFLVKKCFENNQILFIGDTKLNNEITDLQQPGAGGGRSVALIPLTQEQHVVGVIYLDHETKPHHFNQLQTPFLTTFAAHTSIALHNTLLYKRAITDDLTQLYTRQHIDEVLDLEIQRARQENSQMSLLLMDLDHFKQINDTYGHTVGDQVLQTFSRIIQERIRGCDLAGRFGGEEFIIILPDTHQAGAIKFAERIRSAVAEQQFHKNGDVFQVTVSVGTITHQPHHGDNALLLLEQADQALYQAKEQGRNRTVSFAD
jgi:diguanylate cyclase (GGDEF)-like protein